VKNQIKALEKSIAQAQTSTGSSGTTG
jgi:hypothetical protein